MGGGIVLLALSTVAQTLVPNQLIATDTTKVLVNRMMAWGFLLGVALGLLQLLLLPLLHNITPIKEVQQAALLPSYIACFSQIINGLVFVGEGVMIGCRNFSQLSLGTLVATTGALASLKFLPNYFGVAGVWMSFGILNLLRLFFVYYHQTYTAPYNKPKQK